MGSQFLSLWGSLCEGDNDKLFRSLLEYVSSAYPVHFGVKVKAGQFNELLRFQVVLASGESIEMGRRKYSLLIWQSDKLA